MYFSTSDITTYVLALALVIALICILWLEIRLQRLLRGTNGKSLEETINKLHDEVADLHKFQGEVSSYLKSAEERLSKSIRGVETVRFNPFKGTGSGGNQSFSTAFINERGDGVVVSSLYSRERVSTFAKPLKNFSSEFELTEEEKESLVKARSSLKA